MRDPEADRLRRGVVWSVLSLTGLVVVCGAVIGTISPAAQERDVTVSRSGVTCETVQVAMRDGTRLATDVYRPAAPGRYPVILLRTPYGLRLGQGCFAQGLSGGMAFWAEHGYVGVSQDARGTFRSEGTFRPILQEQNDGYDAIEWAAARPWSNGRVATIGASYMGVTQWQAALTSPPHLVAIAPGQTATDYHDHWTYVNGVFDLWFGQSWPLAFFAPDANRRAQIAAGMSEEKARPKTSVVPPCELEQQDDAVPSRMRPARRRSSRIRPQPVTRSGCVCSYGAPFLLTGCPRPYPPMWRPRSGERGVARGSRRAVGRSGGVRSSGSGRAH